MGSPDGAAEGGGPAVGSDGSVSTPTLFRGARIVIGDGRVLEEGELLVRDGRIDAVGRLGALSEPADAEVIDISGFTVIPALIDGHAHLGYQGPDGWGAAEYDRENLVDNLHRYAFYGFGAVFSAGSDPLPLALELRGDQEEGRVGGARFLFGAGMAPPGEGPNPTFLEHVRVVSERTGDPIVRGAGSAEEGRVAVEEIAALGVDVIKIWVDDRGGSQTKMPPETYRAILDEAALRNLDVYVHQQSAADMPDLVEAGAAGFLHGRLGPGIDESLAASMAGEDVFLVPNLGLGELRSQNVGADPFLRESLRPAMADRLAEAWQDRQTALGSSGSGEGPARAESDDSQADPDREAREALRRLRDAGVPIVLGTDAGAVPDHHFGYTGHRELEIFVRLGMTPEEALTAATATAAEQLGIEDAGTLQAGNRADFVVLRFNPLEDIRNTRSIASVYLGGRPVNRDSLRTAWSGQ